MLSMPEDDFQALAAVAKNAAPYTLLRATEIFAKAESELKYSTLPRVIFEAALFKASMPQVETDTEALLSRIEMLEKAVENGVKVAVVEEKQAPVSKSKAEESVPFDPSPVYDEPPVYDDPPVYDMPSAFEEAPDFAAAETVETAKKVTAPVEEVKPVAKVAPKAPTGDAKATFGLFLRSLRKTGRNGVLFTICMDLDAAYEDGVLVLSTESETMYNSMKKEDHYALICQAFAAIGMEESAFSLRLKSRKADTFTKGLEALKESFPSTKIEIK